MSPGVALGSRPEWAFLEALVVERGTRGEVTSVRDCTGLSWGTLIEYAVRQKVLPVLTTWYSSGTVLGGPTGRLAAFLLECHRMNLHTIAVHSAHVTEVVREFEASGIPVVATKGTTFHGSLYRQGERFAGADIDLLTDPSSAREAQSLLRRLGYHPGYYNQRLGLVELDRKIEIKYAMSPDHLVHHCKVGMDPLVPVVYVDVALSITWSDAPWQVPTGEVLKHQGRVTTSAAEVPVLGAPYDLIFTALHMYREANKSGARFHIDLMKLLDVVLLARKCIDTIDGPGVFVAEVARYGLHEPLEWALAACDEVFCTSFVRDLVGGARRSTPEPTRVRELLLAGLG